MRSDRVWLWNTIVFPSNPLLYLQLPAAGAFFFFAFGYVRHLSTVRHRPRKAQGRHFGNERILLYCLRIAQTHLDFKIQCICHTCLFPNTQLIASFVQNACACGQSCNVRSTCRLRLVVELRFLSAQNINVEIMRSEYSLKKKIGVTIFAKRITFMLIVTFNALLLLWYNFFFGINCFRKSYPAQPSLKSSAF